MVKKMAASIFFITVSLLNSKICSMNALKVDGLLERVKNGEKMDVCKADPMGNTFLHYACSRFGNSEYLEAILSQGGARVINKANRSGKSPLDYALLYDHDLEMVKILLEHGAIVREKHIDVSPNKEPIKCLLETVILHDECGDDQKKLEIIRDDLLDNYYVVSYNFADIFLKRSLYQATENMRDSFFFEICRHSKDPSKIEKILQADPYLKKYKELRGGSFPKNLKKSDKYKNCKILCHEN